MSAAGIQRQGARCARGRAGLVTGARGPDPWERNINLVGRLNTGWVLRTLAQFCPAMPALKQLSPSAILSNAEEPDELVSDGLSHQPEDQGAKR
jgi:hypothetical protein